MRVGVLKGPAAGPKIGTPRDPVAAHVENLLRHQPIEAALDLRNRALAAGFEQRVARQAGVPNRRDARLAVCLVLVNGEKLFHRPARDGALRMAFRITQHVEHHHAVRHRRKNRAEPVFAVEPLADPGDGTVEGALPRRFRKVRLGRAQHDCRRRGRNRTTTPSAVAPWASGRASAAVRGTVRRYARPWRCAPAPFSPSAPGVAR